MNTNDLQLKYATVAETLLFFGIRSYSLWRPGVKINEPPNQTGGQCSVPHFVRVVLLIWRFQRVTYKCLKCHLQSQGVFGSRSIGPGNQQRDAEQILQTDRCKDGSLTCRSLILSIQKPSCLQDIGLVEKWDSSSQGSTAATGWAPDYSEENKTSPSWHHLLSFLVCSDPFFKISSYIDI